VKGKEGANDGVVKRERCRGRNDGEGRK